MTKFYESQSLLALLKLFLSALFVGLFNLYHLRGSLVLNLFAPNFINLFLLRASADAGFFTFRMSSILLLCLCLTCVLVLNSASASAKDVVPAECWMSFNVSTARSVNDAEEEWS
jgi:hypothetical protein